MITQKLNYLQTATLLNYKASAILNKNGNKVSETVNMQLTCQSQKNKKKNPKKKTKHLIFMRKHLRSNSTMPISSWNPKNW